MNPRVSRSSALALEGVGLSDCQEIAAIGSRSVSPERESPTTSRGLHPAVLQNRRSTTSRQVPAMELRNKFRRRNRT
jgi:carbamoylphosphate synthase large subunit